MRNLYKPLLSGLPPLRGHLGRSRRCPLNRGLTVLETMSGMSRNSPRFWFSDAFCYYKLRKVMDGMRRSKIWTTKFHAPLDFCLSFSLLLVYSIFVSCFAGHLLSFIYIFACFIFRNISFRNKCFLFCVRETMVSRGRMCKSLAATEFCKRCTYIPFVFLVL